MKSKSQGICTAIGAAADRDGYRWRGGGCVMVMFTLRGVWVSHGQLFWGGLA